MPFIPSSFLAGRSAVILHHEVTLAIESNQSEATKYRNLGSPLLWNTILAFYPDFLNTKKVEFYLKKKRCYKISIRIEKVFPIHPEVGEKQGKISVTGVKRVSYF